MSYKKITIKAAIRDIHDNKMFLPALQRRFVWKKAQIQLLFDSLMRDYPIGTFLFWMLKREKAKEYVFYEFLKDFDEREPFNKRKEGAFLHDPVVGVLDGQQRLSSIFIGLMGTQTEREAGRHATNPNAYQRTRLYLNLLSLPYSIGVDGKLNLEEDTNFEFKFLANHEKDQDSRLRTVEDDRGVRQQIKEPVFWFKVGQVLDWESDPDRDEIFSLFLEKSTLLQVQALENSKKAILRCLDVLNNRFNKEENINYFEIKRDELEEILQVFIRVNSGGTILTKSDLLFSTIVATWDSGREKIEDLQTVVNSKGDKFNFGIEYFMRCCLVLLDLPISYKVNSFQSSNVQKIRDSWENISKAINKTVDLLVEFGFNSSLLASQNSTLVIAYYIFKGGSLDADSKSGIRKYLVHAMLKNIYGSSQEALLSRLREAIQNEHQTNFDFEKLTKLDLPNRHSLTISNDDLEQFLTYKKGYQSFLVLTLLYPNLRYQQVQFHQDHIHPAAGFSENKLKDMGFSTDQIKDWIDKRDCIPNLQFLEGRENQSKNATPIQAWLKEQSEVEPIAFMQSNYFPTEISLDFQDFDKFFEARKDLLRNALQRVLVVNNEAMQTIEEIDETGEETIFT
jgi:hypothetical protein